MGRKERKAVKLEAAATNVAFVFSWSGKLFLSGIREEILKTVVWAGNDSFGFSLYYTHLSLCCLCTCRLKWTHWQIRCRSIDETSSQPRWEIICRRVESTLQRYKVPHVAGLFPVSVAWRRVAVPKCLKNAFWRCLKIGVKSVANNWNYLLQTSVNFALCFFCCCFGFLRLKWNLPKKRWQNMWKKRN